MRSALVFACLLAAPLVSACARPDPPQVTPEQGKVTGVTATGVNIQVRLDAYNPNSSDLSAQSVTAKLTLDGKTEVGKVTVGQPLKLPAKKHTKMDVLLAVPWTNWQALIPLATQNRPIPYRVEGTVDLGGSTVSIAVPFQLDGTLTHEQLVQATVNSLPKVPGINFPR